MRRRYRQNCVLASVLGCIVEGVGPEQLLIRYSIKGEDSRSMHEAHFVVDVSSPSYKGASCEP